MTLSPWRCNSLIRHRNRTQCISLLTVTKVTLQIAMVIHVFVNVVASQVTSATCPSSCECDTNQRTVLCSSGGSLQNILADIPTNTRSLVINGARSTGAFQESHVTASSSTIQELTITQSQIQSIGENAFSQLPNLRKLNLSGNAISSLANSAFSTLYNLQTLDLSANRIESLRMILRSLSNLQHLYLANNLISELPTGVLRNLVQLKSLVLDYNNLATLGSSALQGLSNLQYLSLQHCQIRMLPRTMFYSVRNLRTIHLEHNSLSALPDNNELRNLASISAFHIDNNRINQIADYQFSGWNVEFLSASRNEIRIIGTNTLSYFNAKHIDLSYNRISSIEEFAFKPVAPELRTLDLSGNLLTSLLSTSLEGLYRLESLNLSNCDLVDLPANLFDSLSRLSKVDLSSNKLTNLSKPLLDNPSSFQHISLYQNSWYCDCDIAPLREWLQYERNRAKFFCYANEGTLVKSGCVTDMKCVKPRTMAGQNIQSLNPELITECHTEKDQDSDSNSYKDTLVIVFTVASILVIAAIVMAVFVWKRRHQRKLKAKKKLGQPPPLCVPTNLLNGCMDKNAFDVGSINESDRGFALRNYMSNLHMLNGQYYDLSPNPSHDTKPSTLRTWSQSVRDTATTAGSEVPSSTYIGRESAV